MNQQQLKERLLVEQCSCVIYIPGTGSKGFIPFVEGGTGISCRGIHGRQGDR